MSLTISTTMEISQSPVNNSPSKQMFTFGIGDRFKQTRRPWYIERDIF